MPAPEVFRSYYLAALQSLLIDPTREGAEAVHAAALRIAELGMQAEAVATREHNSTIVDFLAERDATVDALAELLVCLRPVTSNPHTLIGDLGIVAALEEARYAVEEIRAALHVATELSAERLAEIKRLVEGGRK